MFSEIPRQAINSWKKIEQGSGMFQAENHMACGKGRANSRAHVWDTGATQIPSAPGSPLGEARNAAITGARLHGGAVAGVSQPWRPCPQTTGLSLTPAGHSHGGPPSLVQSTPPACTIPSRALILAAGSLPGTCHCGNTPEPQLAKETGGPMAH